jgi:hypothetical protein
MAHANLYPDGKLKTEGYFVDGDLNFEKELLAKWHDSKT